MPVVVRHNVADIVTHLSLCLAVQKPNGFAGSGLCGTEVRIDCTISDGPRLPAHVVTYAEAEFRLESSSDQAEAVGQLWVRRSAALRSVEVTLCHTLSA